MNKRLRNRWIKALRSGEYRQTRGRLKSRNGAFCCLGVLCDIQGAAWKWDGNSYNTYGTDSLPPKRFAAEMSRTEMGSLAERNDGIGLQKKHSFAEMADHIAANC